MRPTAVSPVRLPNFGVAGMAEPIYFSTKTITKLTDAASDMFRLLFEQERTAKAVAKERLRRVLLEVDVFRNSTVHEEPEDWQ